jgi:uncharacterized membrane protein
MTMTRLRWAGYLLGFSFAGFFDGILLHQILQWHHLLSALEGARFADLRVQVLADGVFHALMYVVACVGLWLLWKARAEVPRRGADRMMLANALLGFGTWHIIDAVLIHWLLGLHRIRMDADNLLLWDVAWLIPFGVLPFLLGLWLKSITPGGGSRARGAAALGLVAAILIAGPWAAMPPRDPSGAVVLFRPGVSASERLAALAKIDARVVWSDASGDLWALDLPEPRRATALYNDGALLVSTSFLSLGCLSWSRPSPQLNPIAASSGEVR